MDKRKNQQLAKLQVIHSFSQTEKYDRPSEEQTDWWTDRLTKAWFVREHKHKYNHKDKTKSKIKE